MVGVLIGGVPLIASAELFDGEREGLIVGGGVGFAAVQSNDFDFGSGFTILGKMGYGVSNNFIVHLAMLPPATQPGLGFNYFANPRSPLYVHGALGYASADQDSNILISGGFGYELGKYLSLEAILGLNRYKDTYTSSLNIFTGQIVNETTHYNIWTAAVFFNFTYY